eukprot:8346599-Pyramimonas_sp.AAC.1
MGESFAWPGSAVQRQYEGRIAAGAFPAQVQRHRRAHCHDKAQGRSIHGGVSFRPIYLPPKETAPPSLKETVDKCMT